MSSVVSRTIISTPARDALETWNVICALLTRNEAGPKAVELSKVSGIAASLIADGAPKQSAIVATCDGPRTRFYCIYDEDAIIADGANEAPLGFDPLQGDWRISLPCDPDDLDWVSAALAKHTARVTARDRAEALAPTDTSVSSQASFDIDAEGILGS